MRCTAKIDGIDWIVSDDLVPYPDALQWMDARVAAIAAGTASEAIWLLEHPPLYTAGTSAAAAELLDPHFPVFEAGRGGRFTYHGPGQRVVYLMLDLKQRGRNVRGLVHAVEGWMIAALGELDILARREQGRIGIWVDDPKRGEAKIGAIGLRVRRWVSLHGFSINVEPELDHFDGIVPCGLTSFGVTSMAEIRHSSDMSALDSALFAKTPNFLAVLKLKQCT